MGFREPREAYHKETCHISLPRSVHPAFLKHDVGMLGADLLTGKMVNNGPNFPIFQFPHPETVGPEEQLRG